MCVINLDPANENLQYTADINIFDLVNVEKVMEEQDLGPNGAMVYCFEFLENNYNWLLKEIHDFQASSDASISSVYFIFDLPGQVELFTHNKVLYNIFEKLSRFIHLSVVNLIDSFHCLNATRLVSVMMLSLSTMLRLELPHLNVLSKFDLVQNLLKDKDKLDVRADVARSYRKVDDSLSFLIDIVPDEIRELIYSTELPESTTNYSDKFNKRQESFKTESKLTSCIGELISEFSLVSFQTLNILDKRSIVELIKVVDKTNGYVQAEE